MTQLSFKREESTDCGRAELGFVEFGRVEGGLVDVGRE